MVPARALIDPGSEVNLVSEHLIKRLGTPRHHARVSLHVLGGIAPCKVQGTAILRLRLQDCGRESLEFSALVLRDLGIKTPRGDREGGPWPHLAGLKLADPGFHLSAKVDVLLGADLYATILRSGIKRGPPSAPTAQRTALGWILLGAIEAGRFTDGPDASTLHGPITVALTDTLQRFWELEEIPELPPPFPDDLKCEQLFQEGHSRDETGRYIVRLHLRDHARLHPEATLAASRRLLQRMQTRIREDPSFAKEYLKFMQEYADLGHMRLIGDVDAAIHGGRISYLPHHGIWQRADQANKLRVVFNASVRAGANPSLNDLMYTGPALQNDLVSVLLQWRLPRIAICADIEKMYRQIRVDPRDVDLQRILWESPGSGRQDHYQLITLTYGLSCAPYLALRVLRQLVHDEGYRYPRASEVLLRSTYVDDILTGTDDLNSAFQLRDELVQLLKAGGFPLRKWVSSDPDFAAEIPQEQRLRPFWKDFGADQPVRTLGIAWDPAEDGFRYRISAVPKGIATKRSALSVIARLFDPLGWVSPVVISAKILLQKMWRCKIDWDEPLPTALQRPWQTFVSRIPMMKEIRIPRWVRTCSRDRISLHGFADASQAAYAAVVYLVPSNLTAGQEPHLLIAKTRVAPVKTQTVPPLELCAAVLLSKLLRRTMDEYGVRVSEVFAWSDSSVTLSWLKAEPSTRWPVFVAHRVAQVQQHLPRITWRHVPSEDNPADLATRGVDPAQLSTKAIWWVGPHWLAGSKDTWPPELSCLAVHQAPLQDDLQDQTENSEDMDFTTRFSSLSTLLRAIARCLRLKLLLHPGGKEEIASPLSATDLQQARLACIRHAQRRPFEKEMKTLQRGLAVGTKSPLRDLSPFLDADGIIRVDGRLRHAQLPYEQRHPPILPKGCHLGRLVIDQAHRAALHGGQALTYANAIRTTWIVGGRAQVRAFNRQCVACARVRARPSNQMMGDLPSARITPGRPFSRTGLDYAGPFCVKAAKGRGVLITKGYLAVFICLATKAVHLEVVGDLSTASFLAALRRFAARRGSPSEIWSDNATTFHGADAELRAMFREAELDWSHVGKRLTDEGTTWRFIPPSAPHFGGLWEAAVKSAKTHLRKIIGQRSLTYEELTTLMAQIELCLNSRPLTPLPGEVEDISLLTPSHFLTGFDISAPPEPIGNPDERLDRLTHWQLVKAMRDQFWTRWSREYLNTLTQRQKWRRPRPDLETNDIVVILDPSLLCFGRWPLRRVTATHPGRDNRVRVATVRTAQGEYVRPTTKLCRLPVNEVIPS